MSGLLLAEVAEYGTACVKRAYGNWTDSSLNGWKDQLLKRSIQPRVEGRQRGESRQRVEGQRREVEGQRGVRG